MKVDIKDCTLLLYDLYDNILAVTIGEGNMTYNEKKSRRYIKNKGKLNKVGNDDEEPVEVSFDFIWEFIKMNSGDSSIVDILRGKAGWISTGALCEPYAVNLALVRFNPRCMKGEVILFEEFRIESLDYDLRAGTISCSGKCNRVSPNVDNIPLWAFGLLSGGFFTTESFNSIVDGGPFENPDFEQIVDGGEL